MKKLMLLALMALSSGPMNAAPDSSILEKTKSFINKAAGPVALAATATFMLRYEVIPQMPEQIWYGVRKMDRFLYHYGIPTLAKSIADTAIFTAAGLGLKSLYSKGKFKLSNIPLAAVAIKPLIQTKILSDRAWSYEVAAGLCAGSVANYLNSRQDGEKNQSDEPTKSRILGNKTLLAASALGLIGTAYDYLT